MRLDGDQVDSGVPCLGVDAVAGVVLAGVLRCGLGQDLVNAFSVHWRGKKSGIHWNLVSKQK